MHKWKIRWYHSEQYKTSSYFEGQVLFDTADTYLLLLQVFGVLHPMKTVCLILISRVKCGLVLSEKIVPRIGNYFG